MKLRASHAAAPPLDILDLVPRSRRAPPINFGEISPVRAFGLLVVEVLTVGCRSAPGSGSTAIRIPV